MNVNKIMLIGRLGTDPEEIHTRTGTKMVSLSLATNRGRTKDGEKQTDWHSITAFGKSAERALDQLEKGSLCFVEGRVEYSRSSGSDGQVRYFTRVIASRLVSLSAYAARGEKKPRVAPQEMMADSIPF